MTKKAMIIVNPASSNGKTKTRWPEIMKLLTEKGLDFDWMFTGGPEDATKIARESLAKGFDTLVSAGGDGTLNEVINGIFQAGDEARKNIALGVISMGTGGDFVRTAGISKNIEKAVEIIVNGKTAAIDVGRAKFVGNNGREEIRYFCNTADVGLGGETAARVNRQSKALGGFLSFFVGVVLSLLLFKNKELTIAIDGSPAFAGKATVLVVANGKYFGGGMMITPDALLEDGLLDVLILPAFSKPELLYYLPRVYKGTHLKIKGVKYLKAKKVSITTRETAIFEMDGETPGRAPAEIEVIPAALNILVD